MPSGLEDAVGSILASEKFFLMPNPDLLPQ